MNYMKKWNKFVSESKRKRDERDSDNVVKAIIRNEDNKVLILKGPDNWELPGGHLHKGEDPMSGLKREVEEETSLSLKSAEEVSKHGRRTIFKATLPDGEIGLSSEHTEFKFISAKEVEEYSLKNIYKDAIKENDQ